MKNFYDMLSVTRDASADDIKKAFRREIARYHPDKVQHLGKEFQEMAAGIAADLTEAYRVLMDPSLREKYNADLQAGVPADAARVKSPPPASASEPAREVPPPPRADAPAAAPPRPSAGVDLVRRAAISKIRQAVEDTLGAPEPLTVPGFDLAVVTKPKKGLFRKPEDSVCLLVKFVLLVDAQAIATVWPAASRVNAPGATGCAVMLIGPGMAAAKDLAAAVSEQRRKTRGAGPLIVPVDVRDWEALFPPETPAPIRSLIQRLKDDKR